MDVFAYLIPALIAGTVAITVAIIAVRSKKAELDAAALSEANTARRQREHALGDALQNLFGGLRKYSADITTNDAGELPELVRQVVWRISRLSPEKAAEFKLVLEGHIDRLDKSKEEGIRGIRETLSAIDIWLMNLPSMKEIRISRGLPPTYPSPGEFQPYQSRE